jgi:shikimate dehydrogenase
MKKLYGIIGHPVAHSLSPAMHNAAFARLGIDAEYRVFDVTPAELKDFLSGLSKRGISGINVTIPHKIRAKTYIQALGVLDKEAARLGAVNTVKLENARLKGYNTDGAGFYTSLVKDLGFEPEGKRVFVLGAGGAATAIVMYLGDGPENICVTDISESKTADLEERYKRYFKPERLCVLSKYAMREALAKSDLVINATPIGMEEGDPSPIDVSLLRDGAYVYDLVYNRPRTELVKEALARKLHAVTGLGMLLYQGAIAFEIWTLEKAPVAVMRKALLAELKS